MRLNQGRNFIYILLITFVYLADAQFCIAQFPTLEQFTSSIFKTEAEAKSALSELNTIKNDTARIARLNELAKYFIGHSRSYGSNDIHGQAIELLKQGARLSESFYSVHSPTRYESIMLLAHAYFISDNEKQGEATYNNVIESYHIIGNKEGEAHAWFRLACTLTDLRPETDADRRRAVNAYDHATALYHEMNDINMEILVGMQKAAALFLSDEKNLEAEHILKLLAEKSAANGCFQLSNIYIFLAEVTRYKGNHNDALAYSLAALKALQQSGDTLNIAEYYGELALEYGDLGMSEESIAFYKKCLLVREKLNVPQYTIYRTATLMTAEMIKYKLAAEAFDILQSLIDRNPPRGGLEKAIIEHGMANCMAAIGNFKLAESYYLSMIKGYQKYGRNGEVRFIAYVDAVNFFVSHGQFKIAEGYHDELMQMTPLASISKKTDVELLLFRIDSARSKLQEAIGHYQLFKSYNDSIFNKDKNEQIENLHIRYNSEQQDRNIALLIKQKELQQANLSQSEILRNSLLAGAIMLILLLSLLYNRYLLKTKNNLLLEKQREEISKKNFTQQLLLNEKDWLVREIHHRVKNNFHMVVGLMGTQSAYIKSSEALQALEESKHRIHTMSLIHQKLYQSENLSATQMSGYIHELVSYLKDSFQIPNILFTIECEPIELELSYSLPLGLILNEAITNSIKYAFPENRKGIIKIELSHTRADNIQLIISDNGVGIPEKREGQFKTSMGMNLMTGLTEDIGGIFAIKNDNGTLIQIDFQLEMVKHSELKMTEFALTS